MNKYKRPMTLIRVPAKQALDLVYRKIKKHRWIDITGVDHLGVRGLGHRKVKQGNTK